MVSEVAPASTTRSSAKPRKRGAWRRVIVAVVVGCLVTLGTAWGPGIRSFVKDLYRRVPARGLQVPAKQQMLVDSEHRIIGVAESSLWQAHWNIGQVVGDGFRMTTADAVPPQDFPRWAARPPTQFADGYAPPRGIDAVTRATGLPWRCSKQVTLNAGRDGYPAYEERGVFMWSRGIAQLNLPLLPIWPGLLGNIAVWSAAAFLLLWPPSAIRRARRRRSGRCAVCGYTLMGLREGRCPECGADVAIPPEPHAAPPAEPGTYADGHGPAGGGPGSMRG